MEEQSLSYIMKCRIGLDGYWETVPDRFCELLEYSREELTNITFSQIFQPSKQENEPNLEEKIRENSLQEFEAELCGTTKSGHSIWLYVNGAMIRNNDGTPQYVICYVHNVTENKIYQQKLVESEQKFRSLFQHNPEPVYYFDLKGNFKGVNDKLVEFTGYSRKQLLEMNFETFIVEKDLERTKQHYQDAAAGKPGEYEIQVRIRNGEKRDIRVKKFPMYIGREVAGVFGILHDITRQKHAQQRLKESEERWQRLVKNNPQPVQVTQDSKILFINDQGAKLYGAESSKELVGRSVYEFCRPEEVEKIKRRKNKLEQGKTVKEGFEHTLIRADKIARDVEIYSIPISYHGEPAVQTVIHDVTERKEKEQVIKDSLKEKETLLREIHHRVKNNLAVISGLLELQAMNTSDEKTLNTLRDSQLRIHSIAMIHEKLYRSEALSDIGFDVYLEELVDSISRTYHSKKQMIDITYDIDPSSLSLDQAIPCSLIVNEVVVNCFKHAFKNTGQGKIYITVKVKKPDLFITIRDNGCGLPANFSIDKQQSLGMTLIQTLTQQLDGQFSFSTNPEQKGTIFKLRFATTR
ncbi:MAG: PAS domain S-box protein [Balneolaceae bacterium]